MSVRDRDFSAKQEISGRKNEKPCKHVCIQPVIGRHQNCNGATGVYKVLSQALMSLQLTTDTYTPMQKSV